MSLLDLDERLVELIDLIDFDKSPLDDKKGFDQPVDIGLIEGGCANEHNVHVLKEFRKNCRILVSVWRLRSHRRRARDAQSDEPARMS